MLRLESNQFYRVGPHPEGVQVLYYYYTPRFAIVKCFLRLRQNKYSLQFDERSADPLAPSHHKLGER